VACLESIYMSINVSDLAGFTGTTKWHRWSPLFPKMVMTDGALYVAENAGKHGAFWLMDAIASYQPGCRNSTSGNKRKNHIPD
jgi:hypothetical protein